MVIKPRQDILPKIDADASAGKSIDEVDIAPTYDGADFVKYALMAADNVSLNTRRTIQSDIANVLDCKGEALAFLWALSVKNAEAVDCAIPDFRDHGYPEADVHSAAE